MENAADPRPGRVVDSRVDTAVPPATAASAAGASSSAGTSAAAGTFPAAADADAAGFSLSGSVPAVVAELLERWEALSSVLDGLVVETVEAVCAGPLDAAAAARLVHLLEAAGRRSDQGRVLGARAAEEADLAGAGASGTGRGLSEFKSTADWYRHAERVSTAETNRRLLLSRTLLPRRALTGERLEPKYPHLGAAAVEGEVSTEAAVAAVRALERVEPRAGQLGPEGTRWWEAMEAGLAGTARDFDPRNVEAVGAQWEAAIDQDGLEPSDAVKRAQQGLFYKGQRQGLHRFHLNVTTDQFELLRTVTGAATNPRNTTNSTENSGSTGADSGTSGADDTAAADAADGSGSAGARAADGSGGTGAPGSKDGAASIAGEVPRSGSGSELPATAGGGVGEQAEHPGAAAGSPVAFLPEPGAAVEDDRSRAQLELDGILAALRIALATDRLPSTGGQRPQIMITLDHQTLLNQLATAPATDGPGTGTGPGASSGPGGRAGSGAEPPEPPGLPGDPGVPGVRLPVSRGVYSPLIPPAQLRALACDASVLPAVLGTAGQILDLGRTQRVFTPAQRRALTLRDRGCTFPGCTVPATWCEAHHIIPWHQGGRTDLDNAALCCTFHHTLADNSTWDTDISTGVPLWRPPTTVDPSRPLMRNVHFHPDTPHQTALNLTPPAEPDPIPF